MSVDGTNFRIEELSPFSSAWYLHKFHRPGLRYKVVVAIDSGDIMAVNGWFHPGSWTDIKIFRYGVMGMLNEG